MLLMFYYVINLCILLVNEWFGNTITMYLNEVNLLYQGVLKHQHHVENYIDNLAQDITSYVLQLKKKAAISTISSDFSNRWNNALKEAERKLLKLLLKEVNENWDDVNRKFNEGVKSLYQHNFSGEKEHVQKRNLDLKKRFTKGIKSS